MSGNDMKSNIIVTEEDKLKELLKRRGLTLLEVKLKSRKYGKDKVIAQADNLLNDWND